MLELLAQVVRVDAHHRVLARIEVGAAAEHFHRDLELFWRAAAMGAFDEELEQARVRARPPERSAAHDARRLFSQDFRFRRHSRFAPSGRLVFLFQGAQVSPSLTVNKPLLSHGFLWRNHNVATAAAQIALSALAPGGPAAAAPALPSTSRSCNRNFLPNGARFFVCLPPVLRHQPGELQVRTGLRGTRPTLAIGAALVTLLGVAGCAREEEPAPAPPAPAPAAAPPAAATAAAETIRHSADPLA